jgi:hypothetical protein
VDDGVGLDVLGGHLVDAALAVRSVAEDGHPGEESNG